MLLSLCGTLLPGCASWIRSSAFEATSDLLRGLDATIQRQPDIELVRDGVPTLLLLLDSLTRARPDDVELRRRAALTFSSYAQAFLADTDRARLLNEQARTHGWELLRLVGFPDPVTSDFDEFLAAVQGSEAIDALYAAGSAWLGWILSDTESMEAVADVPRALALLDRVLDIDPDHDSGAVHLVFAVYFAAQPRGAGQDLERSREHFRRAIELRGAASLLPRVLRAEFIGKATLDEAFFVDELRAVLDVPRGSDDRDALTNALARRRARELLAHKDDFF
ncbi:MAG: hypothetical protein KDC38_04700 [Planctomycetes bacterium]|nr:hypothetical protein [Planctomycetota bacterium]